MPRASGRRTRERGALPKLDLDRALIAVFIGAMNANGHVSPAEAARTHHLIWSTHRFRRKSGETVGRIIDAMRTLLEERETSAVLGAAIAAIPVRLRPSTFAVVADLLLADDRIGSRERTLLQRLGRELAIAPAIRRRIVDVILLKNQL